MPGQGARMSVGNLVRITRTGMGIPAGSIGMIVESWQMPNTILYVVKLLAPGRGPLERRYLARDLDVISS